jgi:hypothetical protein
MGGVEDAVADGVGGGGVGEVVVPVIELAGEDRRADAVAVLQDLEQVATLGVGDGSDGEVVDDEDIETSETCEHARERAVGASETELVEESWRAAVGCAESLPTSPMGERAREVRLAGARCARDEHAVVLLDPAARRQLSDDGLVELPSGVALDALDARLAEPELGLLEGAPDALRLASDPLRLDEESEALVERHGLDVGVALLVVPAGSEGAHEGNDAAAEALAELPPSEPAVPSSPDPKPEDPNGQTDPDDDLMSFLEAFDT